MGDDITIGVTEIVNNIEVTAQPNDQVIDINVTDNSDEVTLNVTPNVIEVNINKGSSYARWGSIFGNITDQADLTNALFNKADLVDGKVPSYQLPSFVDDVIEVVNYAALPTVGEIGKIYITLDTNKIYRWSGSIYIEIASNQAIWGAITGSLTNQTDLVNALNLKANISGQVFTGAISATNLSGTNTGDQDLSGLVPNTRTLTINGTTFDLSADRTYTIPTHDAVTLGTANGLSLSGQVLSLGLSGASSTGALSSTDWNTFNNKLSSLSGAVLTTTDQSITGTKTFNVLTSTDAIFVNNSGGRAIRINNSTAGFGLLINNGVGSTAIPLLIQKNGTTNFSVSDLGHISTASIAATTIVKSGGTSSQYLMADGSVSTLTNPITGTGTTNFLSKFTASGTIGNSQIFDNGTFIGIGISTGLNRILQVVGSTPISHKQTNSPLEMIIGQFDDSGNAIINNTANAILGFSTNNQRAMTILPNLKVGIGTTSPNRALTIVGGNNEQIAITSTTTKCGIALNPSNTTYSPYIGATANDVIVETSGTERMRITSGGDVLVGTTTNSGLATGDSVNTGVSIGDGVILSQINNTANQYWSKASGYTSGDYTAHFVNNVYVGGISTNGTTTNYAVASDYRLKQDFKPFNGLYLVSKIKVYDYEWKADNSRMNGVIAHELQEVIPYAVTGKKDDKEFQSVDYSKLVPILVQAIQELKAEIEILKNK